MRWSGKDSVKWQRDKLWKMSGKTETLAVWPWLSGSMCGEPRSRRSREAPASSVTCIVSFLAKPALQSHRLMLPERFIINENEPSIASRRKPQLPSFPSVPSSPRRSKWAVWGACWEWHILNVRSPILSGAEFRLPALTGRCRKGTDWCHQFSLAVPTHAPPPPLLVFQNNIG